MVDRSTLKLLEQMFSGAEDTLSNTLTELMRGVQEAVDLPEERLNLRMVPVVVGLALCVVCAAREGGAALEEAVVTLARRIDPTASLPKELSVEGIFIFATNLEITRQCNTSLKGSPE